MVIKDFDSVFVHIGGFGKYQMVSDHFFMMIILFFCVNYLMCAIASFVYFGQFFMTLTPPHWCAPPPDLARLNLTSEQVKRLTIPRDPHSGKYLECVRYQVDFSQVVENQTSWPVPSWPTISCTHGWVYDFSLFYPAITSQFFVGSLVGSPVLGWAADAWGRLPVIVATNVVGGLGGVASAFCSSFVSFVVFRFIVGMTYDTHYMVAYILIMEYVSTPIADAQTAITVLAMLGRLLITMPGNVGLQYKVEVLPTVARAQGMAFIYTVGFVAALLSPYVVYLSKFGHFLPYTILGVATVVGGLACVLLPETLDQKLPDTLEDGEDFFAGQGCCYDPCARYKTQVSTSDDQVEMSL
ncbi:beta-alanine transporter-like [Penaeus chinensis]|uniref:beta-alanine transporter-like n=1 Tax=Penaeus chinensis TaxID=139456 RepID=UPI001FB63386|nr:beta-alanine transporter-like [Penaeus chinensis]